LRREQERQRKQHQDHAPGSSVPPGKLKAEATLSKMRAASRSLPHATQCVHQHSAPASGWRLSFIRGSAWHGTLFAFTPCGGLKRRPGII
jgi:hypothetical protein